MPTPYQATHLIQESRVRLAVDYLAHEFAKILPFSSHQQIRQCLEKVKPNRDSSDVQIRDFWNLFAAVSGGWRLKELVTVVTAGNIAWELKDMHLALFVPETMLGWMAAVRPFSLPDALVYLRRERWVLEEAEKESRQKATERHPEDSADPLIGRLADDGRVIVLDGNRRLMSRIEVVAGRSNDGSHETLQVWVGQTDGRSYREYWVPTSHMFFVRDLGVNDFERWLSARSSIAAQEFATRVLAKS